ncbi:hypothetical protein [Micromonospora sp. NPDC050200]|uniref:hypothetical protein n=1 Tax=Micromonospora sp. NPDC050200 TaxID=3155664 RepID=UPI003404F001
MTKVWVHRRPRQNWPRCASACRELFALYRFVGPVSLPDITNGYFLHPLDSVIGNLYHDDRRADRIGEPLAEDVDIVVFGSNGGAVEAFADDGSSTDL